MALAPGVTTSIAGSTTGTTDTMDITSATAGEWVYFFGLWHHTETTITFTNWTQVLEGDISSNGHYAVYRRKKVAGDTTFAVSWATSTKYELATIQYTGADPTTPDELAAFNVHTTTNLNDFTTSSLTPNSSDRWAVMWAGHTGYSGGPLTWTADGALTERLDVNNGTGTNSSAFEVADSNAAVTQAAHSYTATAAGTTVTANGGGAILFFLIPAASTDLDVPLLRPIPQLNVYRM